jgi:hypothetical protein
MKLVTFVNEKMSGIYQDRTSYLSDLNRAKQGSVYGTPARAGKYFDE